MPANQIRTTVYLDENLYIAAKKKALEERSTLTALIKQSLRHQLSDKSSERSKRKRLLLGSYNLGLKKRYQKLRRVDIYEDPKI